MVNVDDLRRSTLDDSDFDDDDSPIEIPSSRQELFLGMTPLERMFISMFLFMNVAVLGIALLLATGRMGS